jgi:hypothetical protein
MAAGRLSVLPRVPFSLAPRVGASVPSRVEAAGGARNSTRAAPLLSASPSSAPPYVQRLAHRHTFLRPAGISLARRRAVAEDMTNALLYLHW